MIGRRQIAWFLAGFIGSSLLVMGFRASVAEAQTRSEASPGGLPQRQPAPLVRRQQLPPAQGDNDTPAAIPQVPRSPLDNVTDAEADGDGEGSTDAQRNAARRPAVDGAPASSEGPGDAADGSVENGEPRAVPDGADPEQVETRPVGDVDAFERPPAGYDALAFQIDDLEPILDRRPARLARFEPYDPLGIRRGSWVIFPEAEFGLNRTSNVLRDPSRRGAFSIDVKPTLRAVTDWRKHAVELSATGLASFYGNGFASENDRSYAFEAKTRIDLSRRTNIEMLASTRLTQDARGSVDAPDSAKDRADVQTQRFVAAVNHRFNRLSVQLRGSYTDTNYSEVATQAGGIIANAERDNVAREIAARATWAFKPALFAFTEVALNVRAYNVAPGDGIRRNSDGERFRFGVGFGDSGRTWRGEAAIGYGRQKPDDARLTQIAGLILDANVGWRMNALTSFLFTARTDFNDSTTANSPGALTRVFGVEARHAFQRHLIGTAALRQSIADYKGISLTERETTGELGLEYFLSRNATVFGRYTHVIADSSTLGADYTVDTVRVGMKIRQ